MIAISRAIDYLTDSLSRSAVKHHLSTWLLITVLIAQALIVRPALINFIAFAIVAAFLFLIRDIARMEGQAGAKVLSRSTVISLGVITLIIAVMTFGIRYVAV